MHRVARCQNCHERGSQLGAIFLLFTVVYRRGVQGASFVVAASIPGSHVAARSKRARRYVALYFWSQRHVLSTGRNLWGGQTFDRRRRMLELWNNWYETLTSVEALATIIVIAVLGAGVIALMESRRR
jgi:hypothetical protein